MGPNNWGIFLILPVTTGEGIGPAGEISPVVCMLKNGLLIASLRRTYIVDVRSVFSLIILKAKWKLLGDISRIDLESGTAPLGGARGFSPRTFY